MNSKNQPVESDVLKQYIAQLFKQYDTDRRGSLSLNQLSCFFNDLLKSVGVNIIYTYQQLYEVIYMANPTFNGYANPDDVYKIFRSMLNHSQNLKSPQLQPQMPVTIPTQYQAYNMPTINPTQNMQTIPGMQGQYIPIYNPYLMQLNQFQQPNNQFGQMWGGYGGYMGINPYTGSYRQ